MSMDISMDMSMDVSMDISMEKRNCKMWANVKSKRRYKDIVRK